MVSTRRVASLVGRAGLRQIELVPRSDTFSYFIRLFLLFMLNVLKMSVYDTRMRYRFTLRMLYPAIRTGTFSRKLIFLLDKTCGCDTNPLSVIQCTDSCTH